MKQANTLEVRKIIHSAIAACGRAYNGNWTDPVKWSDYSPDMRVVTFRVSDSAEVAKVANYGMKNAGYSNTVRVTGDYVRVNAPLPFTVGITNGIMHS